MIWYNYWINDFLARYISEGYTQPDAEVLAKKEARRFYIEIVLIIIFIVYIMNKILRK